MFRTLALLVAISTLGGAVGLYATSLNTSSGVYEGPRVLTLGGAGDPPATVRWTITDGKVTGAEITWTPEKKTTTIQIKIGGSIGWSRVRVGSLSDTPRTDSIIIKPPVDAALLNTAKVNISGK